MKKVLRPFILLATIALMTIAFSADAGQKPGDIHLAHYFDSNGDYVVSSSRNYCEPCGSWLRDVFACNCESVFAYYIR